jgi:hypothetical protein
MGKGVKRAAKGNQDFGKKRQKVGRKLAKAQNETSVDVRSRQISLPQQNAVIAKDGGATNEKLALKVLTRTLCGQRIIWPASHFA